MKRIDKNAAFFKYKFNFLKLTSFCATVVILKTCIDFGTMLFVEKKLLL